VLERIGLREKIEVMFQRAIDRNARHVFLLDKEGFKGWFLRTFGFEVPDAVADEATQKVGVSKGPYDLVIAQYDEREKQLTPDILRQVERYLLLKAIDDKWRDHLYAIDALKAGIGLRGYAQVDPKNEYKREGFQLFEKLLSAIEDEVTSLILRIQINRPEGVAVPGAPAPRYVSPVPTTAMPKNPALAPNVEPPSAPAPGAAAPATEPSRAAAASAPSAPARAPAPPPRRPAAPSPMSVPASHAFDVARRQQAIAAAQKAQQPQASGAAKATTAQKEQFKNAGRNDPCPCGSGQKFKNCHGK
jgi:preprotein translocase subunit SecA